MHYYFCYGASMNIHYRVEELFRNSLEEQIKNRSWKEVLKSNVPEWLRRQAVAKFWMTVGHDCLAKHLCRIGVLSSTCMLCSSLDIMDSAHIVICPALLAIDFVDRYWEARDKIMNFQSLSSLLSLFIWFYMACRAGSDGSMSASGSAGPGFNPRRGSKFSFENFQPRG